MVSTLQRENSLLTLQKQAVETSASTASQISDPGLDGLRLQPSALTTAG